MENKRHMKGLFDGTDVIELTDDDFDLTEKAGSAKLKLDNPGLVMFYSAQCPHCISKKELYSELAKLLNEKPGYQIYSVHVKDPASQKVSQVLKVMFVPSFFEANEKGELLPYEGEVTKGGVMQRAKMKKAKKVLFARPPPSRGVPLPKPKATQQVGGHCPGRMCHAITANGHYCSRRALADGYCWQH